MNVNDKNRPPKESLKDQQAGHAISPHKTVDPPNKATPNALGAASDMVDAAVSRAKTSNPSLAPAPRPPAPAAPLRTLKDDIHAAMDAEKSTLVTELLRGGTLNGAAQVAMRIAELHGKPRHADEVCAMADRLIDDEGKREQVKLAASLVVLGEWKSPAKVMLGGRLNDEEKRAHIFPINKRAAEVLRQIEGGEPLAQAIEGLSSLGVTPWLHASRDISAMDAPRKWRQDESHPDGRLSLQEIRTELEKNNERPGRDPKVTTELFARYQALRYA